MTTARKEKRKSRGPVELRQIIETLVKDLASIDADLKKVIVTWDADHSLYKTMDGKTFTDEALKKLASAGITVIKLNKIPPSTAA